MPPVSVLPARLVTAAPLAKVSCDCGSASTTPPARLLKVLPATMFITPVELALPPRTVPLFMTVSTPPPPIWPKPCRAWPTSLVSTRALLSLRTRADVAFCKVSVPLPLSVTSPSRIRSETKPPDALLRRSPWFVISVAWFER